MDDDVRCPIKAWGSESLPSELWACDRRRCAWWIDEEDDCAIHYAASLLSSSSINGLLHIR